MNYFNYSHGKEERKMCCKEWFQNLLVEVVAKRLREKKLVYRDEAYFQTNIPMLLTFFNIRKYKGDTKFYIDVILATQRLYWEKRYMYFSYSDCSTALKQILRSHFNGYLDCFPRNELSDTIYSQLCKAKYYRTGTVMEDNDLDYEVWKLSIDKEYMPLIVKLLIKVF